MTPRKEHGSRRLEDLSSVMCFVSDLTPEAFSPIDPFRLVVVLEETVVVVVLVFVIIGGFPVSHGNRAPRDSPLPIVLVPLEELGGFFARFPAALLVLLHRIGSLELDGDSKLRLLGLSLYRGRRDALLVISLSLLSSRLSLDLPVDGPRPSLPAASQRSRSGARAPLTGMPLSPGAVHWPGTAPAR